MSDQHTSQSSPSAVPETLSQFFSGSPASFAPVFSMDDPMVRLAFQLPDLVWAKDMEDRYIFVNQAACTALMGGAPPEAVMGRTDAQIGSQARARGHVHTLDESALASDRIIGETGKPGRFVEEGFAHDHFRILDIHKSPLMDGGGRVSGTVCSARDITQDHGFEQRLTRNNSRFSRLLDQMASGVCVASPKTGNLLFVNQNGARFLGKTPEELVGRACKDAFSELVRPGTCQGCCLEFPEREGADVMPCLTRIRGRAFKVHPQTVAWTEGEEAQLVMVTDITREKRFLAALKASETKFRALFDSFQDAVFLHPYKRGGFSHFEEVNQVACRLYGYSREAFLKMGPTDLIASHSKARIMAHKVRRQVLDNTCRVFEVDHVTKDGQVFPVEISVSLFEFYGQKMFLTSIRDITERRERRAAQKEVARLTAEREKYALVGQVAGKMAHDFNNILGGIMGNAEMSLMDCTQPEVKANLNIILQQTLRGRNLTKNLVAFAKDQEPRETWFDLNQTLDLVLNLMKKELIAISVVRNYDDRLPDLLADQGMIEHALVNLIQNSVHAMTLVAVPRLEVSTRLRDNRLVVCISDNGCGIPHRFHGEIYTPSFTLKGSQDVAGVYAPHIKGTGYGMANVKKYIEKHRGRIAFESREGEGTCFELSFPHEKRGRELTPTEKKRLDQGTIIRRQRILLVEDEAVISCIQQRILSQVPFEHQVTVAKTGEIAIQAFNFGQFDLVSLDYMLPGRMNGLDVYHHIRSRDPLIPILFISGNMDFLESMEELAATDPFMDHISKPCENIVYVDTLNALLLASRDLG